MLIHLLTCRGRPNSCNPDRHLFLYHCFIKSPYNINPRCLLNWTCVLHLLLRSAAMIFCPVFEALYEWGSSLIKLLKINRLFTDAFSEILTLDPSQFRFYVANSLSWPLICSCGLSYKSHAVFNSVVCHPMILQLWSLAQSEYAHSEV